jgi:tetratricopeptide (TPR) repeat protein
VSNKDSAMGIPLHELLDCELRASASGFRSRVINLLNLTTSISTIDVGPIVLQRAINAEGMTLSATDYKAPQNALRAYQKGIEAERRGKLDLARKYFEQAVEMYPKYTSAWFKLGAMLEKEHQPDAARTAYLQATALDGQFLPPYLSLSVMAFEAQNWTEVVQFTGHILDLDPLNRAKVTGYIVDLDPLNYAEAYFYNSFANYKLNRIAEAEKSALKAEHLDLRTLFPQLHLLLADIYIRKNDYASAISQIQTYLELAPHAADAVQVRLQLAKLEKLNSPVSTSEQPDPK